ncbi:polyketide synthase dehydratase-domain-containing protein [Penicillium digitatum]|uniref:Polyketide synthase dehydratase-domain-containing protein n=1 Tax=Penicillium digitatum TaxID=36651 RepID=A0A7T6XJ91_PENDI|nr:polyketide synthase dehydratase-domain-containing protein [Penicillium digitatum]
MAVPHHRHRTSLEGVIFPPPRRLSPEEHDEATKLFNSLIEHFEPLQASNKGYKPLTLLRLTKGGVSVGDEFLELFFTFIQCDRLGVPETTLAETLASLRSFQGWTSEEQHELSQSLVEFSYFLMDNFYLPLKSLAAKTPQPTPAFLSRPDLRVETN